MRKFLLSLLLLLVVAALAVRLALPGLAKRKINEQLSSLEGYNGRVASVGLSLLRGRVTLRQLEVWDAKEDFRLEVPVLRTDVSWGALFRRTLVADVAAFEPVMSLTAPKPSEGAKKAGEKARKAEANIEKKTGKSLEQLFEGLMPFRVSSFRIVDGAVLLKEGAADQEEEKEKADKEQRPSQPVRLGDLQVLVEDLTNTSKKEPAKAKASATLAGGTLALSLALRPLEESPTFDLNAEARKVDLAKLSPLLRWQWNVDVERGQFEMVAEAKAEGGAFKGYVKPFIQDIKAAPATGAGPAKKVKQAVVGVVAKVLKNKESGDIATRLPFEGRFDDPKTGVWQAVVAVLRNAFVEALSPTFEKL